MAAHNINVSVSSNLLTLPRAQKYIPKVSGAAYKRSDITENTMIRHCDSIRGRNRKVSINFLRVMLKQLTSQIDATTEPYAKMRLVNRKSLVFQAIKGFQFCYKEGDKQLALDLAACKTVEARKRIMDSSHLYYQAESARRFCRMNSIVLPDEKEVTRKVGATGIMEQIGNSSTSGIRVTHNLKGSDFNGSRFAPNGAIVGMVPLKADTSKDAIISDTVGRSKTVKLFDERQGKVVDCEVELADTPKVVRWSGDTKFAVGRNTFLDRTTDKKVVIPNPHRVKVSNDKTIVGYSEKHYRSGTVPMPKAVR